jgi:hypothetical protein
VFGNYDQHIMRLPGDRKAAHVQRLPSTLPSTGKFTKLAKGVEVDVLRGEHGFRGVPSVACVVIVIGGYIHAGGAATVSARVAVWLSEPEVPVKTTLALPGWALLAAVRVTLCGVPGVSESEAGLAVTPAGNPLSATLALP